MISDHGLNRFSVSDANNEANVGILLKVQQLDRRYIYALVFVLVAIPILVPFVPPLNVGPQAQSFYDVIEKAPKDKVIFFATDFSGGVLGENKPQCVAVMEHVMRRGLKFIIFSLDSQGADYGHEIAQDLARQYPDYKKYGEKWVNFGFKYTTDDTLPGTLQALGNGFRGIVKKDKLGSDLDQIPMMKGLHDFTQVAALCEFTGSGTYEFWVRYLCGAKKITMLTGCTGIIGPRIYPYLDSGQMSGLLNGMKGAAEYEKLLGHWGPGKMRRGGRGMNSQSLGAILIITLILLGNMSMLAEKRQSAAGGS